MSELFDKEVNAQKESLKKLLGFMQAHEKMCNENERNKGRKTMCVKMLLMEGSTLYGAYKK